MLARALLVAVLLMTVLSSSRNARATGDLRPLVYVYVGLNGGFVAYDVASAALREKNDVLLGGQLAIAGLETAYISLWGYRDYELGLVSMQALPPLLTAYPLLAWSAEPPRYWQALGESASFGLNWALTFTAFRGEPPGSATWFSVTEIALLLPRAVGTAFILRDFEPNVLNVVGLAQTLWSAVLAVDGVVRLSHKPPRRTLPAIRGAFPELRLAADGPFPRRPGEQRGLLVARWPWL